MNPIIFNENDESNHFPELIQAVIQHLDYKKWGFSYETINAKLNAIDFSSRIIFQSEQCKVQVRIFRDARESESQIDFLCGRLHAANDDSFATWNGEKLHCWQVMSYALNFLDGLTPQETVNKHYNIAPKFYHDFYANNINRGWSQFEMIIRRLSGVWNHYGENLFNLFDLRHPDLWQKYYDFHKEIYYITTTYPDNSLIPRYKIC